MYATKLNLEPKKIIDLKKMIESIIEVHLPLVAITLLNKHYQQNGKLI